MHEVEPGALRNARIGRQWAIRFRIVRRRIEKAPLGDALGVAFQ
jgi:hypothetical protein